MFDQNLLGQTGAQGDAGSTNPTNQIGSTPDFFHDGILTKTHLPEPLTGVRSAFQTTHPDLRSRSHLRQVESTSFESMYMASHSTNLLFLRLCCK